MVASHLDKEKIAGLIRPYAKNTNFYTRYQAVKSLAQLGCSLAADTLVEIADDQAEDLDMRLEALMGLIKCAGSDQAEQVAKLLADPIGEIRVHAATVLAQLGDQSVVDKLIEALEGTGEELEFDEEFDWDPQWDVQLETIKALGTIADSKAAGPIIKLYEEEYSQDLAHLVFHALCKIGTDEAQSFLREKLKGGDSTEKRRIIESLGENKLKGLEEELEIALADKDPETRVNAARALYFFDDEGVTTGAFAMLGDDDEWVRARIVEMLDEKGLVEGHEGQIAPLIGDESLNVRAAVAKALKNSSFAHGGEQLLKVVGEDTSDEVVINSIETLLSMKAEVLPHLLAGIAADQERYPFVRIKAVDYIKESFRELAPELLIPLLETEPRQVAVVVAMALAESGDEGSRGSLLALLDRSMEPETKLEEDENEDTGSAITEPYSEGGEVDTEPVANTDETEGGGEEPSGGEDALPVTQPDEDGTVMIKKKKAILNPGETPGSCKPEDLLMVLAVADYPEVIEALTNALNADNAVVASTAAKSLGELKASQAVEALLESLEKPAPTVRARAAYALGEIGGGDALAGKLSEILMSDYDDDVRDSAALALGMIKSEVARDSLTKGLEDHAMGVRKSCIEGLGKVADSKSAETLIYLLFDFEKYSSLRKEIASALKNFDSDTVTEKLLLVLDDAGRESDHWVAIEALGNSSA